LEGEGRIGFFRFYRLAAAFAPQQVICALQNIAVRLSTQANQRWIKERWTSATPGYDFPALDHDFQAFAAIFEPERQRAAFVLGRIVICARNLQTSNQNAGFHGLRPSPRLSRPPVRL
jgi:hypothetical protein